MNPPVIHTIPKYTITASCDTNGTISPAIQVVDSGKSAEIVVNPQTGFEPDSLFINGQSRLMLTNNYTLLNVNSNNNIKVTFKRSKLGLLIQKPWKTCLFQARYVGDSIWREFLAPPALPMKTYIYYGNNRFDVFDEQNILIANGTYSLNGDFLIRGFDFKINLLTNDTLKIVCISKFAPSYEGEVGYDSEIQYTYIH